MTEDTSMKMVAVPYAFAVCSVCGAAATRAVREYNLTDCVRLPWRLYCDKHGPQAGRGLNTHPSYYQRIKEV